MDPRSPLGTHAIVPLAVLEAVRSVDAPSADGLGEYHHELAAKRLGMSRTVAVQIERFASLAAKGGRVNSDEVGALMRLVGRRSDAGLVFADAGRRAAHHAHRRIGRAALWFRRLLPRFARNRFGFRLARRVVGSIFDLDLTREDAGIVAVADDPASARATPDGAACGFYGSAVAAVLRDLTDFDGAVLHPACRARGAKQCRWDTAATTGIGA